MLIFEEVFMSNTEKEIIEQKIQSLKDKITVWSKNKEVLLKEYEVRKNPDTPLKEYSPSNITRYIDEMFKTHLLVFADAFNINSLDELEIIDSIYNQPYTDVLEKAIFILSDSIGELNSEINNLEKRLNSFEGIDQNTDADDEITVPQFIENYFRENHIKIELVDNKSQLERELHKKWNELYPEKPRTLSTFHRNLPRK